MQSLLLQSGEHGCEISEHVVVVGVVVVDVVVGYQRLQLGAEDPGDQEWHVGILFRIFGGPTPVGQPGNGNRS